MALRDIESRSPAARGLRSALSRGRLAHAYIFGGPEGSVKVEAARELARAVLCESPENGDACGACQACRLVCADSHPDLEIVRPEKGKVSYPVRQIREEIRARAYLRPARGPKRFLIIERAEGLVRATGTRNEGADTLLKVLEEPPAGTCLILLTARPERLPETVRSRCQLLRFEPPPPAELVSELTAAENMEEEVARFVVRLAGQDPSLARELAAAHREKGGLDLASLRRTILEVAGGLEGMPYPDVFAAAAALESGARDQPVFSGALEVLSLIYRDAGLRALSVGGDLLAFPAGAEAVVSEELAGRFDAAVLSRLAWRVLEAQERSRRYPARLLLLEVLLIDLKALMVRVFR